MDRIDQPGDPLQISLAADLVQALMALLDRAKSPAGQCYLSLYELTGTELELALIGSSFVHIILSNTGPDDSENTPARQAFSPGLRYCNRVVVATIHGLMAN